MLNLIQLLKSTKDGIDCKKEDEGEFLDYAAMIDRLPQPAFLTISLRPTELPYRKQPQTFEDEEVTTSRSLR
ncbi:hypothetical protein L2E82_22807 [Cichorium intybus]|uniref:Uncharacterized protein n=1 Tax=Cichorium intybus TaxID=13427 RepID=A0ACB9DZ28_CICIN|nr:hypothetical protein L2E82_22807 [Cichorium intybus]